MMTDITTIARGGKLAVYYRCNKLWYGPYGMLNVVGPPCAGIRVGIWGPRPPASARAWTG